MALKIVRAFSRPSAPLATGASGCASKRTLLTPSFIRAALVVRSCSERAHWSGGARLAILHDLPATRYVARSAACGCASNTARCCRGQSRHCWRLQSGACGIGAQISAAMNKLKHGGARPGAGRKAAYASGPVEQHTVLLCPASHLYYLRAGAGNISAGMRKVAQDALRQAEAEK